MTRRVIVITGAAGGIGHGLCRAFLDIGDVVWAFDRSGEGLEALRSVMGSADLHTAEVDITESDAVRRAVSTVVEQHGRLDIAISNAGGVFQAFASEFMADMTARWRDEVDLNLNGPAFLAEAVRPHMEKAGSGAIVFIGSVNGLQYLGHPAYTAAKAGLIGHTRSLACLLGPKNVRVNLIAPGTVRTPAWESRLERDPQLLKTVTRWYPLGRVSTPADIAGVAVFLASDAASMITGVVLPVDGGLTAGNIVLAGELS